MEYTTPGNCSRTIGYRQAADSAPDVRGGYLPSKGLYAADNHPLSTNLSFQERQLVLGWVYSSPPSCLVERIESIIASSSRHLIVIHTTLDSSHWSLVLNLLVSLHRCQVDESEVLLVVYDYEPIPGGFLTFLDATGIQYISVWEFMLPSVLQTGSKFSAPQFFFVRNAVHLKLLKMGYHIVHMDSDIVVLRDHPFSHFDTDKYSIEAAPGSSPMKQRRKWGHTLNCGYMSLASTVLTVQFLESFLAYNFDSEDPIDQWAFNEVLFLAGVKFRVHRGLFRKFAVFETDKGPINGYVRIQQDVLNVRMLSPQEFLAGRWLLRQEESGLSFASFVDKMHLSPRTVHVTHIQGGVHAKIESMKTKGLWFLRDDWETLLTSGMLQSLGNLDGTGSKSF